MIRALGAGLLVLCVLVGGARADERILDFHSEIVVARDGSMEVTETIRVRAEGRQIRRGIYRDFPTRYRSRRGHRVQVGFTPEAASRDGKPEVLRSEPRDNGVRVYLGTPGVELAPGEYTWVLRYRTDRQLGFFGDRDELYWNVTGNGWIFPIDHASASVSWPGVVPPQAIQVEGYTGPQGSRKQHYRAWTEGPSHAGFETTRPLGAREGLTIVMNVPAGEVIRPHAATRARHFLRDNGGVLVLLIGVVLVFFWYLAKWWRIGRDPRPGTIFPRYEPPPGITPGGLRRVVRMRWDNSCMAADLVDLAVRGALRLHQEGRTWEVLPAARRGVDPPANGPQAELFEGLLGDRDRLAFLPSQHAVISKALKRHQKALKEQDGGRWFRTNRPTALTGMALSAAVFALALWALKRAHGDEGFGVLVWLGAWTIGGLAFAWPLFFITEGGRTGRLVRLAILTGLALIVLAALGGGLWLATRTIGLAFPLFGMLLVGINALFLHLLPAPTAEGRKLKDWADGLRLYLGVAERDELARSKAPPMTLDEFQRFLPWALALGVEQTWADRFAAAVGPAAAAAAAGAMSWYRGDLGGLGSGGSLAGAFGSSLSGAIASSSVAPGSSSGSGGGGSSGGGGGGGGGGGW